jgi:hypothetical protein
VLIYLYFYRELKVRQWNRPTLEEPSACASTSTPVATSANRTRGSLLAVVELPNASTTEDLPKGWRACVDKKTGRTYYVNE